MKSIHSMPHPEVRVRALMPNAVVGMLGRPASAASVQATKVPRTAADAKGPSRTGDEPRVPAVKKNGISDKQGNAPLSRRRIRILVPLLPAILYPPAASSSTSAARHTAKPTIVLVHAAFAELRDHLQRAIEPEYATLPPCLCALCSLARERNSETAEAVHGVLTERILRIVVRDHGTRIARGSASGDMLVWPIKETT